MKHSLFKRLLSLVLCLLMVVTMMPLTSIESSASATEYYWPVTTEMDYNHSYNFYAKSKKGSQHGGLDFPVGIGSPVYASASGTVILAEDIGCTGSHPNGRCKTPGCSKNSYNNYIKILDDSGNVTLYAHLLTGSFPDLENGMRVEAGEKIALSGEAGNTTGPHLHFEINKNGRRCTLNPADVLKREIGPASGTEVGGVKIEVSPNYPTNFSATAKLVGEEQIKTGKIPVYSNKYEYSIISTNKRWIDEGDPCTIQEVYTNGMCKVTYPGTNGSISDYYAKIENFNLGDYEVGVNRDGVTRANITAKYLVYPEWIYPGTKYGAYSGAVTSNYPLASVTVRIYSRDFDGEIKKTWKAKDGIDDRVVILNEDLPIKPEEFAGLRQGKYIFKVSASCNKRILGIFDNISDEVTIFESNFTISINHSNNDGITCRSEAKREVVASQGITKNYNSGNTINGNTNNYYNGVSSYPIGTYKVKVNTSLNVRKGPGTSYAKVSSYKNGTTVDVTATNGNWGYTGIGWICLDYATFVSYAETTYDSSVSYGTGNYVVTTAAGLNCRTSVGTSAGVIKTLPHGTQFSVTQTDGAWGYSPEHGGWLCLQYASYVSALTPSLPIPALPNLSTKTSSEIGVGEVISFKWDAVDTAELYNVKLVDANTNAEVQSTTVTGTNASFKAPYEGKFNVSVSASNSQHDGPAATLYGFYVKGPSTVTFKDWDGKVISTQSIAYGKDATAPAAPSRVGHTFTKWEGNYTTVREDQIVTATYTKNKYKVTFCDYDGTVLTTQDVYYGDAATAPKYEASTGYSFVKWDNSFNNITKATTVKAVISWTSLYPLEISTKSAVQRNNKSYIVTSIVNNSPNAVSDAKIIAVIKTKENKLLATVQSDNLTLAKGEVKNLTLSATYDGMATQAELFVVKADNENIPLAKHLNTPIDQGTAWSSWSTSTPPSNALQTQSRTEYRYRDKQFTTSTSSSLSGWTLRTDVTNPTVSYGSWGAWSAWQDTPITETDTCDVETQVVDNYNSPITETRYTYKTVYHYFRYSTGRTASGGSDKSGTSYGSNYYTYDFDYELTINGTTGNYAVGKRYYYNAATGNTQSGSYITVWACSPLTTQEVASSWQETVGYNKKTQYRYRTRTKTTTYYFWKWGDWSSWSPTAVSGTSNRAVETRTTYRYLANTASNIETTAGEFVERNGYVDKSYSGRQALLFVSAQDGTTQFVGQTVIGTDGAYAFKFKTKDEPTVASGDYNVTLSIEGTSAAFELDPIKAPVPEYTVKFIDYDGTVVSEQTVKQNEDASVPAPLSREGYRFIGWDKSYTNIQGNVTINAQYEIKSFDVVFVDEINDTSVTEKYNYGDTLVALEVTPNDAYNFLGWDAIIDGTTTVNENMVVTAKFEKKMFTVDFLDFDGSLLETQTIEYGEPAIIPTLESRDNYVFICWKIPGDTTYVTESMTIEPYYEYTETVATPVANIETGTYNGVQTVTLTCATEGAQIYYTTDGSDPLEEVTNARARSVQLNGTLYTGPFELDSTSQLLFTAVKDGMNASDYDFKTLAINTADTETKQYTVTIHYGIYDAENTILVNDGELVVLDEELENYGYTLEGIYTDAEYKSAWNIETDTVKNETDLYLKWSKNNYTVTFKDMNGNVIEIQTVAFGDDAVAPIWSEVEGYIFTGWDTDYTNVIEDITVTATYVSVDDVTSVEFDKETLSIVEGQSETITATVKLGTDCENDALIWQSSDEDVVIVDDNGKITAVSVGAATIFAISEDSGMSAQCEVTVDYKDPCAALGHKHEGKVTVPTCTEKGYTTYTCSECGDTYTDNEKSPLGHDMSVVIPILAPSCENEGQDMVKCSRCEYSEVQQIEATGHCDNDSNNVCDDCGKELSASSKCSCNCHKTGFMSFIWKILRFFYKLFGMNKVCGCGVAHY